MNLKILIPILLILSIFLSGCTKEGIIDCGDNLQCFQSKGLTCTPAKVQHNNDISDLQKVTMYQEIKGSKAESCMIYTKVIKVEGEGLFPNKTEGQSMNCIIPKSTFGAGLGGVENFSNDTCSGKLWNSMSSYFDLLKKEIRKGYIS